jgi:hypothetical protein
MQHDLKLTAVLYVLKHDLKLTAVLYVLKRESVTRQHYLFKVGHEHVEQVTVRKARACPEKISPSLPMLQRGLVDMRSPGPPSA